MVEMYLGSWGIICMYTPTAQVSVFTIPFKVEKFQQLCPASFWNLWIPSEESIFSAGAWV